MFKSFFKLIAKNRKEYEKLLQSMDYFLCGTAICKDFMSVPVRDEMAAANCLPGFHIHTADAILRIIFPHPCSTILSTWTLILSNGTDISSGKRVKPWL